jgi:peptidoglycan/LPS O-acetylase OafA/YrhL
MQRICVALLVGFWWFMLQSGALAEMVQPRNHPLGPIVFLVLFFATPFLALALVGVENPTPEVKPPSANRPLPEQPPKIAAIMRLIGMVLVLGLLVALLKWSPLSFFTSLAVMIVPTLIIVGVVEMADAQAAANHTAWTQERDRREAQQQYERAAAADAAARSAAEAAELNRQRAQLRAEIDALENRARALGLPR